MKLLAIDGNSLINRAFYGIKLLSTKDGRFTNAVYGFINILNKLLDTVSPDGVAVAFDLKSPTFRHKKYAEYKAGRHAMPEELKEQFPVIKDWLKFAGYSCIECEGFEADDILGTLAASAVKNGNECVIATGDRDSLQLVSDKTHVLLATTRMGKTEVTDFTPEAVEEKYGVTPKEMIQLKALMGDSSDNIKGVAGMGEKTATDLISKYHSIDYVYENLNGLDIKPSVKAKLESGKESAYLSLFLGTISTEAPIDTDFEHYKKAEADKEALSALMTELEFFSLMDKMGIKPNAKKETVKKAETTYKEDKIDLKELENEEISLIFDEKSAVCFKGRVCAVDSETAEKILKSEKIKKQVYNSKGIYKKYPEAKAIEFDAMLGAYLSNPSSNDYSFSHLCELCGADKIELSSDELTNAARLDAVCGHFKDELEKSGELKLLREIEIPLSRVLSQMESEGFLVDKTGLKAEGEELLLRINELQKEIYSLAGIEFNINSPKQLGEVLFGKLMLPAKKKTKSGYSTGAEVLEGLQYDYPIVKKILKYRQLTKLKSTYCDGLLNAIAEDGRIHTTFNQTEARTGRISSLEPNLQNIPVRTDEGRKLRKFFIAKDGFVLCDADYSQIELRVLASMADDKAMIEAFNSGEDIHTATAAEVFNIPKSMVLPIMRSRAKAVNFGIVYGIGAFSLSKDIGVTRAEADRYIKNYLETYKGVAAYMENAIKDAKENGYVTTAFGRRRYLPELSASNRNIKAFGERVARNAPIQGTAADIIKIAMIKVSERLKKEIPEAKLILQVHDELIVEAPEEKAKEVCKILETEMEKAASLKVKLLSEAHCGKNWLEAKG